MIHDHAVLTRRGILLFAAALRLRAAESEFWNRKDPSEWSADEIDRLITKSPWAKEITVSPTQSGQKSRGRAAAQFSGVVRWESAKPVLDAMKTPLPSEFSNHYVISVSGIPMSSLSPRNSESTAAEARAKQREIEGVLDRLKSVTRLEPKGAAPAQPGIVQETPFGVGETRTLLFGFSKTLHQISPDNQEIGFATQMGTIQVKVKFNLKEMMYHSELAV
jgi:hypothetical protein